LGGGLRLRMRVELDESREKRGENEMKMRALMAFGGAFGGPFEA